MSGCRLVVMFFVGLMLFVIGLDIKRWIFT